MDDDNYVCIKCSPLSVTRFFAGGRVASGEGGPPAKLWTSSQIFKKWGLDRTSTFRGGLVGKREVTFFREVLQFSQYTHKQKSKNLKYLMTKKVDKEKYFSLS